MVSSPRCLENIKNVRDTHSCFKCTPCVQTSDFSHTVVTDPVPISPTRLRIELPANAHLGRMGFPPESSFSPVNRVIISLSRTMWPPFSFSAEKFVTACPDCFPSAYVNFFQKVLAKSRYICLALPGSMMLFANSTCFGKFF